MHGTLCSTHYPGKSVLISFRNPSLQYSLGFISLHCVIHSFQDYSIHPLYLLLRSPLRAPCCVTMLRWHKTLAYNFVIPRCASALSVHHSFQSFYCTASRSRSQDNSFRAFLHCLLLASKSTFF